MSVRNEAPDKLEYDRVRTRVYMYIDAELAVQEAERGNHVGLSAADRIVAGDRVIAAKKYFEAVKAALGVGS